MNNENTNQVMEMERSDNQVAVSEQGGFLAMMERLALSNVDVVKIEKMMDLHERMLNRNAKSAFAADYVRMKPHLPKVLRTKNNTQTKSKYAPLENINQAVDPILEQYGFGTSTKILSQTDDSVTVRVELWHKDGHIEETTITMPLDKSGIQGTVNKTGPHATSSSVTYAKRVAICALLNISTGDDKDGNQDASVIDTEQAAGIDTLLRETGARRDDFLKQFKITAVSDLKIEDYKNAHALLMRKKELKDQKGAAA